MRREKGHEENNEETKCEERKVHKKGQGASKGDQRKGEEMTLKERKGHIRRETIYSIMRGKEMRRNNKPDSVSISDKREGKESKLEKLR